MWEDPAVMARIWRAAVEIAVAMAEAVGRTSGNGLVAVQPMGDGVLVALGPGRYVNRSVGVGPDLDDGDLDRIEAFFSDQGLPASVELSSWAGEATLERLASRGFRPDWFRSVLAAVLPLTEGPDPADGVEVVKVDDDRLDEWLNVFASAFETTTAEGRAISDEFARGAHCALGVTDYLAVDAVDGRALGCGSLRVASGVAELGGAATLVAERGRGVQGALLRHRVRAAAEQGCDLVVATALPASTSARNIRRYGLHQIDTLLALTRPVPP
jgi:hypothetical protein